MSSTCPRLGFELRLRLGDETSEPARSALRSAFAEALDARGLSASGSGGAEWIRVVWREGSQADHEDQKALVDWASSREEIVRISAGPIVDLLEAR
jgi:uncharacterized protein YggL (DUF469 family)